MYLSFYSIAQQELSLVEVYQNTSLFEVHKKLKAKIVPFAGWNMPVFYEGVLAEHKAVRESVGVFDVSHMGEISVKGPDSFSFLQNLTTNDLSKLSIGQGQYSLLCNRAGGVIDDLIIYRMADSEYFLCVNASNTDKDFAWLKDNAEGFTHLQLENQSPRWSQLALQGPLATQALIKSLPPQHAKAIENLNYMSIHSILLNGFTCYFARTGYTGEKGYELYLPNSFAVPFWNQLFNINASLGIKPIGLGARDTLRLEACYLLYGQDMDDTVSPFEAQVEWAVKLQAKNFIGKEALVAQKELGLKRKLFAFKMEDAAIPRQGMDVLQAGKKIGKVTSGSVLPTVGGSGGMVLLAAETQVGDSIDIDIRGKLKTAKICAKPLYKAKVKD